jgi:hypothetical protein
MVKVNLQDAKRNFSSLLSHPRLSKIKINYDPTEPLTPDELGPMEI